MKINRLTAIILAVVMLATTCCGTLLGCSNNNVSGSGTYMITFNANGGTVNPKSAVTTDSKLSSLPTPYKKDTEVLGWYLSSEFAGEKLTVDYNYSFSCLIHAKWGETVITEYTVSFDANGGTLAVGTEAMVTVNNKLLAFPLDPTPPKNCSFLGWYTEKEGGEKVDTAYEFTNESKNVTVYAQYAQEYVITFDSGVGTITESFRLTTNGRLMGLPAPTGVPDDRTFIAWYTKIDGGRRVNSSTVFTEDCTIYARYLVAGEFLITLDANGGRLVDDDVEEIFTTGGGVIGEIPIPIPSRGYGFYGWFTAPAGGEEVTADTKFTNNETIYAQYIMVEFFVSFNANGGKLSEEVLLITEDYKLERLPYRPFAPKGFRFVGWFTEKEGGVKVDTDYLFTGTPGTRTLYAHYDEAVIRDKDGLWLEDVTLPDVDAQRGDFSDFKGVEVWAYDVNFKGNDIALEIWYGGELITNVELDEYSTEKVIMTPDKMLRLAEGADISNSIINVSYKFGSNLIFVQEIIRADIHENDGVYLGKNKIKDISQNLASAEVYVENLTIGSGGATDLTIVLGGETVEIAHLGMGEFVEAVLALDKKNIIIAEGTYSLYYKYNVTDTTSDDYKSLWISGVSIGDLPVTPETSSPYYMVGSSATLGLTWNLISSVSLIPDKIHLIKSGDTTYSLTVDLYAGNEFKILKVGSGWSGAYDYNSLTGNTGSTQYFSNSTDGNNNIVVSTSGNYTLTIDTAKSRLSFVRNGEAASVKMTYDIYIHGSFVFDWTSMLAVSNRSAGTITFEYKLTAELEFGIITTANGNSKQIDWGGYSKLDTNGNNTGGGIIKTSDKDNFICKKSGTYRFTLMLDSSGYISWIKIDTVV